MTDLAGTIEGLQAIRAAVALFKDALSLMPNKTKREQVKLEFDAAERQLQIAEADVAKSLGHELCNCAFPPAIMTKSRSDDGWTCPRCGNKYVAPKGVTTHRLVRS